MTKAELRQKIKTLAVTVMAEKTKTDDAALAYDELVKFPTLKILLIANAHLSSSSRFNK